MTKILQNTRFLAVVLVLWHGLIFTLSHIPNLNSGLPGGWDFVLRKFAHAAEFGVLAAIWVLVLRNSKAQPWALWLAGGFSVVWAALDEYHQTFIIGRVGSPIDVLIDTLGILLVLVVARGLWEKAMQV